MCWANMLQEKTLMRYIKVDLYSPHNANVHEDIAKSFLWAFLKLEFNLFAVKKSSIKEKKWKTLIENWFKAFHYRWKLIKKEKKESWSQRRDKINWSEHQWTKPRLHEIKVIAIQYWKLLSFAFGMKSNKIIKIQFKGFFLRCGFWMWEWFKTPCTYIGINDLKENLSTQVNKCWHICVVSSRGWCVTRNFVLTF